jgi:ADP-ribose pyrophosphatase YjhB (NUDIX family)
MIKYHAHFGIYGYLKNDDSILLIKKARGPYKGMYDLPGGSPYENETNEETLTREIKEETGIDIISCQRLTNQVITIFYNYSLQSQDYLLKHSALLYSGEFYNQKLKNEADGEDSNYAKWIKISELANYQTTPFVKILVSKF